MQSLNTNLTTQEHSNESITDDKHHTISRITDVDSAAVHGSINPNYDGARAAINNGGWTMTAQEKAAQEKAFYDKQRKLAEELND